MTRASISEILLGFRDNPVLELSLADHPLDEVLFGLHTQRFTGAMRVGPDVDYDRLYFREGAVVGLMPPDARGVALLCEVIPQLRILDGGQLEGFVRASQPKDVLELGQALVQAGWLTSDALDRAMDEMARHRLFALYSENQTRIRLLEGIEKLAYFHPIHVDVRPAVAFGTVVKPDPAQHTEMVQRFLGKRVRLTVPYDENRNSYGLPPPVLIALRDLARGVKLGVPPRLPTLSERQTIGVLRLFDRMSLLSVE